MAKKYGAIVNLDLGYTGLVVCGNERVRTPINLLSNLFYCDPFPYCPLFPPPGGDICC